MSCAVGALLALAARVLMPATADSVSLGTVADGSLRGGVSMPVSGPGFVTYSALANWLGRQYVHVRVRDTLLAAFASLEAARPGRTFVMGETGFEAGGRFPPHRTHQNGLSVDIFMPVRDAAARSVPMPTAPWRKFGYALEFDREGVGEGLSIDFASLAELLVELDRHAQLRRLAVQQVIVAPEYVNRVLAASAPGIRGLSPLFLRVPAWVRHDEHVHVDFAVARIP